MKGIILFLELPKNWHLIVFAIVVLIILGIHLYYLVYKKQRHQEISEEDEKITPEKEMLEEDEKTTPKIDGYHSKGAPDSDYYLFISDVDDHLRVREMPRKNHDTMVYATSLPHRLILAEAERFRKSILELGSIAITDYEVRITKSPAAKFSDFDYKIKAWLFTQLHTIYAGKFFRQRVRLESSRGGNLILNFLDFKVDEIFAEQLLDRILVSRTRDFLDPSLSNKDRHRLIVFKGNEKSFSELKADVLAVFAEYFPVGVDFEGEWPEDEVIVGADNKDCQTDTGGQGSINT